MDTTPHVIVPATVAGSQQFVQPPTFNPAQNWFSSLSQPYNNQEEWLPNGQGDLMQDNCTLQGVIETVQALFNWYKNNNNDIVATYIKNSLCNAQGYVKLSVRYLSILAGVKLGIGVSVDTGWDTIAKYGMIPDNLLPTPSGVYTFEQYITPTANMAELISFGENQTKLFQILWSVIQNNVWTAPDLNLLKTALYTSPIMFASGIGNIDQNDIEQPPAVPGYGHCRVIYAIDDHIEVLDNYPEKSAPGASLLRKLALTFPIACAIKAQIKII